MQIERLIAFTVDVDPDLNLPTEDGFGCISKYANAALFDCCAKGLSILTDIFEDTGIQATLFFEGRTASKLNEILKLKEICKKHEVGVHGLEHEDFTIEEIGKFSYDEKLKRVREAKKILKRIFGNTPEGFRAPYLHADMELLTILEKENFAYDSSIPEWEFSKWKNDSNRIEKLVEFPIPFWETKNGKKIYSYLWPMHEGEKEAEQYIDALTTHFKYIRESKNRSSISEHFINDKHLPIRYVAYRGLPIPMIATHPWHILASYAKGKRDELGIEREVKKVCNIIENLHGLGCTFLPLKEILKIISKEVKV
jgi:peptidoglycan/xylan/chitin deacetylase (PgdA/CDA1 family)